MHIFGKPILRPLVSFIVFSVVFMPIGNISRSDASTSDAFINGLVDVVGNGDAGFSDDHTSKTSLAEPGAVEMNGDGLVFADSGNNMIRVLKEGKVNILVGMHKSGSALLDSTGGFRDGAAQNAELHRPGAFVKDKSGNYFIVDTQNNCIRKLSNGTIRTFAGAGSPGYVNGSAKEARFNKPTGITIDGAGNIYVADSLNNAIRKITPIGDVTTFSGSGPNVVGHADGTRMAATFNEPQDIVYDSVNKRYFVADSGNQLIRMITGDKVSTFAGIYKGKDMNTGYANPGFKDGPVKAAEFNFPKGLQVYKDILIVTDTGNHAIRIIKSGKVGTLVGDGSAGTVSKPLQSARLNSPADVFYDGKILYIADTRNNRIRSMEVDLSLVGSKQVRVVFNGKVTVLKESIVDSGGSILLPFESIMKTIGGTYKVDLKAKTISLKWGTKSKAFTIKTGVIVVSGKAYLSLNALESFFGADKWDYHQLTGHLVIRK